MRTGLRGLLTTLVLGAWVVISIGSSPGSSAAPSRSDLASAQARLQELERDFGIVVERYDAARAHLEEVNDHIASTEREVERLRAEIDAHRGAAVELARELYKGGGGAGALQALLGARSVSDVESGLEYLNRSNSKQIRVFERLAADEDELTGKLEDLNEARADASALEQRLADLRTTIEAKLASQRAEIERLNAAIERAERRRELRRQRAEARAERLRELREQRAEARAERLRELRQQRAEARADRLQELREQRAAARQAASDPKPESPPSTTHERHPAPSPAPAPSGGAATAVHTALAQVGDPYQWGAAGPDAFDCSGLTMYSWASAGVSLPHSSSMQYSATTRIPTSALQPGDLLFYGSPIHHVTMYIGGGRMVEAPYTGLSVRVVSDVYRPDLVGAGRP